MKALLTVLTFLSFSIIGTAQLSNIRPSVSGNIETTFQYLTTDSTINAIAPEQIGVMNSYSNINYSLGGFKAGVRFESYLPAINGYPAFYSGSGIGYRYVEYTNDILSVTGGNFYEQFGSGMIFRSYEARGIGLDNAMDGARLLFTPRKGVRLKGIFGKQRYNFENGKVNLSEGIVRGLDGDFSVNELFTSLSNSKLKINFGGSFVSKYQAANNDSIIIPKNVGSYAGRVDLKYNKFYLNAEYVHKDNDPSEMNNYIYNSGHAALVNLGYSQKGFAVLLSGKSIDNMDFRSDRTVEGNQLFVGFTPALTKNHTYNLATLYPYASVPLGEIAYQLDVLYKIPKKTLIGGKYGTSVNLNIATSFKPIQHTTTNFDKDRVSYEGRPFDKSDSLYHFDINIELKRKINKKLKLSLSYFHFQFNNKLNNVTKSPDAQYYITSDIIVLEGLYKISRKHSIRAELQGLFTKVDKKNWSTLLIEYNISPKWFFAVMDQYNYGNSVENERTHYLLGSFGYTAGASRFMFSYGKQREGILCIGGVCRPVPATNGLTFTFTSSF